MGKQAVSKSTDDLSLSLCAKKDFIYQRFVPQQILVLSTRWCSHDLVHLL